MRRPGGPILAGVPGEQLKDRVIALDARRQQLEAGGCQTNANSSQFGLMRSALVGAELPPLGESSGAGLLVGVAVGK